jgi:hypothetical protein
MLYTIHWLGRWPLKGAACHWIDSSVASSSPEGRLMRNIVTISLLYTFPLRRLFLLSHDLESFHEVGAKLLV